MSHISTENVKVYRVRMTSKPQASVEKKVDLSSRFMATTDRPTKECATKPEKPSQEKRRFLNLDILSTKGINSWLKSLYKPDQKVAEDERRKLQKLKDIIRNIQEAEDEKRKIQEAEDLKRRIQEAEDIVRKIKEAEDERKWIQQAEDERRKIQELRDQDEKERLERKQEQAAIVLQEWLKTWKARQNFKTFMTEENPPLRLIAHFSRLVDPLDTTFIQELQLNKLKGEVVSEIKATQQRILELHSLKEDVSTVIRVKDSLRYLVSTYKRLTEKNSRLMQQMIDNRIQKLRRTEELESSVVVSPLHGRCSLPEDLDSEMENLRTLTKKLVLDIIRVQPGETLHELLNTPSSEAQEYKHWSLMNDSYSTSIDVLEKLTQNQIMADHYLSLVMKKKKVQENLEILQAGLDVDLMDYNSILAMIAKDIRMKHKLRQERETEMEELRKILLALNFLSRDLQDRIDLYKQYKEDYVNVFFCQETARRHGVLQNRRTIQYTAKKLLQKGVIVRTYGDKNLKREVLSIEAAGGNVLVKQGGTSLLIPLLLLLKMCASSNPTIKIFHYEVNASLFLFLVCCKIFRV